MKSHYCKYQSTERSTFRVYPWDDSAISSQSYLSLPDASLDDDVYILGYYCRIDMGVNGSYHRVSTVLSLTGTPELPRDLDPIRDIALYPIFYHEGFIYNTHELNTQQTNALDHAIVAAKKRNLIPDDISISNDFTIHPLPWNNFEED